jgi:hypothetical protein
MSLQYIIDGCNITHNPSFLNNSSGKLGDTRAGLIDIIRQDKLCGSSNNRAWVVFDGYPGNFAGEDLTGNTKVLFSCDISADDRIKQMLERCANPLNTILVSNDKELAYFARGCRVRVISVEKFMAGAKNAALLRRKDPACEAKVSFSVMHRINEELKKIWLK